MELLIATPPPEQCMPAKYHVLCPWHGGCRCNGRRKQKKKEV
jgi:hypothetical protein